MKETIKKNKNVKRRYYSCFTANLIFGGQNRTHIQHMCIAYINTSFFLSLTLTNVNWRIPLL